MINIAIGLGKNKKVLSAIKKASENENLNTKIAKNSEKLLVIYLKNLF